MADLPDAELYTLVDEFFDDDLLMLTVYSQFLVRGNTWPRAVRQKLGESLAGCGLDEEAEDVLATLT